MDFVYLVYDECHGLRRICRNEADADDMVCFIAMTEFDIDIAKAPFDFNSPFRWGWDVCCWVKEKVYN